MYQQNYILDGFGTSGGGDPLHFQNGNVKTKIRVQGIPEKEIQPSKKMRIDEDDSIKGSRRDLSNPRINYTQGNTYKPKVYENKLYNNNRQNNNNNNVIRVNL